MWESLHFSLESQSRKTIGIILMHRILVNLCNPEKVKGSFIRYIFLGFGSKRAVKMHIRSRSG